MSCHFCIFIYISENLEIESTILSGQNKATLLNLMKSNQKFIGNKWNLLFRYEKACYGGSSSIAFTEYKQQQSVLCIVQTGNDDLVGVYSSDGWIDGSSWMNNGKAYMFGLRSSKEPWGDPILSDVSAVSLAQTDIYYWNQVMYIVDDVKNLLKWYVYCSNKFDGKLPDDSKVKIHGLEVFEMK